MAFFFIPLQAIAFSGLAPQQMPARRTGLNTRSAGSSVMPSMGQRCATRRGLTGKASSVMGARHCGASTTSTARARPGAHPICEFRGAGG
jgi:hypothetical protein